MNEEEFNESIKNILHSFALSKEKIGAVSIPYKLLPTKIAEVSKKFASGIPISNAEILEYRNVWLSEDPLVDENGNPFVFYIHDFSNSHWGKPNHVFHISWCPVLEKMDKNGRRARYVKKSDIDNNDFIVDYGNNKRGIEHLPTCIPCKEKMQKKVSPKELYYKRDNMDIRKFFDLYGKQDLLNIDNPMYPVDYPKNWNEISKNLRDKNNWICNDCGKDFLNNKSNLHVHHKDGRKGVLALENLEVVCVDCHSKKFGHGHVKNIFSQPASSTSKTTTLISSSQKNKLDNFIKHPERYATNSEKSKLKVQELQDSFNLIKDTLNQSDQIKFNAAIKIYKDELDDKF